MHRFSLTDASKQTDESSVGEHQKTVNNAVTSLKAETTHPQYIYIYISYIYYMNECIYFIEYRHHVSTNEIGGLGPSGLRF